MLLERPDTLYLAQLAAALPVVHDQRVVAGLEVGGQRVELGLAGGDVLGQAGEPRLVGHRIQSGAVEGVGEPIPTTTTLLELLPRRGGVPLQVPHAVAAGFGPHGHQAVALGGQLLRPLAHAGQLGGGGGDLVAQGVDLGLAQGQPEFGEVGPDGHPLVPQPLAAPEGGVVGLDGLDQRLQRIELDAGALDGVVGAGEVLEVPEDALDPRRGVGGFEHVGADELVEVAHRLHGDGLVEQLHGLLGPDPQQAAHRAAVGREVLLHRGAGVLEPGEQRGQVGAEVGEVALDRQGPVGGDEPAPRLAGGVLLLENLREGHLVAVALVAEHAQDHRVRARVPQPHGPDGAGGLVALGLVVALDVGPQGAFLAGGAGGLVVVDPVRGQHQRAHRVHEGGLAAADVAGEQERLPRRLQVPYPGVEGPPVEDLQPGQAEPGPALDPQPLRTLLEENFERPLAPLIHGPV